MIIKRQFKMYNITIHNTQHLCLGENVAKHSVRYNGVLHFDPASLNDKLQTLHDGVQTENFMATVKTL